LVVSIVYTLINIYGHKGKHNKLGKPSFGEIKHLKYDLNRIRESS